MGQFARVFWFLEGRDGLPPRPALSTGSFPAGRLVKLDITRLLRLGHRLRLSGIRLGRVLVVEDRLDEQGAERWQVAWIVHPRVLLERREQLLLAPLGGQHLPQFGL